TENRGFDLKADTLGTGQMAHDRVKAIAGARERIDDTDATGTGDRRNDRGDVIADLVPERVFDGFKARAGEDAHTALIPFLRRHPVEMNVIRVVEAVTSVLFDLPQFDALMSLFRTEQEVAVVPRSHVHNTPLPLLINLLTPMNKFVVRRMG